MLAPRKLNVLSMIHLVEMASTTDSRKHEQRHSVESQWGNENSGTLGVFVAFAEWDQARFGIGAQWTERNSLGLVGGVWGDSASWHRAMGGARSTGGRHGDCERVRRANNLQAILEAAVAGELGRAPKW